MDEFKEPVDINLRQSDGIASSPSVVQDVPLPRLLKSGELVGGRYKILSLIGKGAMGSVYRAEQVFLRREVALKTINASVASDIAIVRFQKEAQAANKLEHPNLVRVTDFGMLDEERPFFVMELAAGETLATYLKERGVMPVSTALKIFIAISNALDYAHEEGIVHRDIKPSNIMLVPSSDEECQYIPKIIDFGIARLALKDDESPLTKTGEIFGTPLYMSPEQCMGTKADRRSDIYSLGCVLFEALTGTPPFKGDSVLATMMQHKSGEIPSLKEASLGRKFEPALENILHRMLTKDPDARYQRCMHVARDLMAIEQGDHQICSFGDSVSSVEARPIGLKPVALVLFLCFVALVLVLSGLVFFLFDKHPDFSSRPERRLETSSAPDIPAGKCDLVGQSISDETLRNCVPMPMEVQVLFLGGNVGITDKSLDFIKELPLLTTLGLGDTQIDDSGMAKIGTMTRLKSLLIHKTRVTDAGVKQLRNLNNLQVLSLINDKITDKGVKELVSLHLPLRNLALDGTKISGRSLRFVQEMPLKELGIGHTQIGDTDMIAVGQMTNLCHLFMNDTKISDAVLKHFRALTQLQELRLSNDNITDEGVKELFLLDLPICYLDLKGTRVTDRSLRWLLQMKSLRKIDVGRTKITLTGRAKLQAHCARPSSLVDGLSTGR